MSGVALLAARRLGPRLHKRLEWTGRATSTAGTTHGRSNAGRRENEADRANAADFRFVLVMEAMTSKGRRSARIFDDINDCGAGRMGKSTLALRDMAEINHLRA